MDRRANVSACFVVAALACGRQDAAPKTATVTLPLAPTAVVSAPPPVVTPARDPVVTVVIHSADPYQVGAFQDEDAGAPTARLREGDVTVSGRLPHEVVARIVRQSLPRIRTCFVDALRANPRLAGTVATKLIIDAGGRITAAERDAATNVDDASVVTCVTSSFSSLSFPPLGPTTAVYAVTLETL